MADKRTRRRFTAAFKAQAVKRLVEDGHGLSEVATELGLSTGQLSTWRTEILAAGSAEALAARDPHHTAPHRGGRRSARAHRPDLAQQVGQDRVAAAVA